MSRPARVAGLLLPLLSAVTAWAQESAPSASAPSMNWGAARLGLHIAPVSAPPVSAACGPGNPSTACRPPVAPPVGAPRVAACAPGNSSVGCRPPGAPPPRQSAQVAPPAWRPGAGQPNRATGSGGRHGPPPSAAQERVIQQAAMGDQFGGRIIPPDIRKILADRRIEPITAYLLWQAARRPIEEWTMRQLQDLTSTLPTLIEAGIPLEQVQTLYKFLELDPNEVFNPQFGQDWQTRSTRFDPTSTAAVAEISTADCQTDPGMMTVATFRSCTTAPH